MTIRAGQIGTPDGYVQAVVNIDPTTGSPATTDGLTNAQLRATPVPVDPSTITATNALWNRMGANATIGKHFTFVLWTDGTQDGSSGGSFAMAGAYAASPRVVYYTFATGAIITELAVTVFGTGTFVASGWGTGATLTNGFRMEVVSSNPTNVATVPTFRMRPNGSGNQTLIRGLGEIGQLGGGGNGSGIGQLGAMFINCRPLGGRGIYVPPGSSFRVIAQDDTNVNGVTACNFGIAGYEL